ncbi:hypothetical protein DYB28_012243 [Aphanomyces astaci]|uniref:PDZ domain-containing protein n=1 Tax=Aphanomyces astaci TaxID=112090 RepID=A0A9X8HE79_APHAT|nr:hypothetical protein DYB28_012243 [Aphanomyces astaci]
MQADHYLSRPSEASFPQSPPRPDYEIVWDTSSLGIAFRCNSKNLAVIRRIEQHAAAQVIQLARVGDVLLATNGEPSFNFDATMDRLRALDYPIVLTFGSSSRSVVAPPARSVEGSTLSEHALPQQNPRRFSAAPSLVSTDMNESIASRDLDDPDNVHHMVFSIEWQEGLKLGVSIIKLGNIPVVKERTVPAAMAPPSLAQIQALDQLVSIQGHRTIDLGYQASIVLLRDAKKPVLLEFRRKLPPAASRRGSDPPLTPTVSSRESDYSLVWEAGPLGLTLKKDNARRTMVVSRVNGDDGLAARCKLISVGDRLVSVSNVNVHELGLRGTMEFLKAVPKPATLVFHRPAADDVEASASSMRTSSVASSDEALCVSCSPTKPFGTAVDEATAEETESDAPEADDHVAPLAPHEPSMLSSSDSSKELVPQSTMSTDSGLDDSGLSATRLHAAPASSDLSAGPPMLEIVWESGPLGMTLKQSGSSVVVSRLTGKGEAENLRVLQMGDILVGVNSMDTSSLDLEGATTLLKSLVKPARLRFILQKTEADL